MCVFIMIMAVKSSTKKSQKFGVKNMEYRHFLLFLIDIINRYVPLKQKYIRANQCEFVTDDLNASLKISKQFIKRKT